MHFLLSWMVHLNAEFQSIARKDEKAFFSDQCKEIEENNRMGKTRDAFKKIRDTKGTFHASSVQSLSHVWLFVSLWTAACQASMSTTNSRSLLKLMSIEFVMPSHPLSSPSSHAFNPSQHQGIFQWVSSSYQVAKVLELQHQFFQWIFTTDFL